MRKRMLCLLCALMLLLPCVPASAAKKTGNTVCYSFDLSFSLNADAFPLIYRSRARGYAALLDCLSLKGTYLWKEKDDSVDILFELYFPDRPGRTYSFRLYGTKKKLFLTSPLIGNENLQLSMNALLAFTLKAKANLNIPLPYVAFLFPYMTEHALSGVISDWNTVIGSFKKSGKVTVKQMKTLFGLWAERLDTDPDLERWVSALVDGSRTPDAVEAVFAGLPDYYSQLTANKSISVKITKDGEVWKNGSGRTLYSRTQNGSSRTESLTLPAGESGYTPSWSFRSEESEGTFSFDLFASLLRDLSVTDTEGAYTDTLLRLDASGAGLPLTVPSDSSFTLSASLLGTIFPNFAFTLLGETKSDGSLSLSLRKPETEEGESVEILHCAGSVLPASSKSMPAKPKRNSGNTYNVFSFNDQTLPAFTQKILPQLVRSIFSFVEAVPTSACQSFLDDLTDMGLLDMLLE